MKPTIIILGTNNCYGLTLNVIKEIAFNKTIKRQPHFYVKDILYFSIVSLLLSQWSPRDCVIYYDYRSDKYKLGGS
jgi:hypothetical protein